MRPKSPTASDMLAGGVCGGVVGVVVVVSGDGGVSCDDQVRNRDREGE